MRCDLKQHIFQAVLRRFGEGLQRDFKAAALHAQVLHGGADGRRQARRRLLALARHRLRGLQPGLARGVGHGLQLRQVAGGFQPRQIGTPRGQHGGELFRRAAKAPRQAHPLAHAVVERGELFGVEIGAAQVGVQAVRGVARLRDAGVQHVGQGGELGFDGALIGQCRQRALQRGQGAFLAIVAAFQRRGGGVRGVDQRLRVRQARVALVQLVPFAVGRRQLVEFADLPQQAFAFFGQAVLRGARGLQGGIGLAPGLPGGGQGFGIGAGVGVEQFAHGGRPRQALPSVLAVDVDQPFAQRAQLRQRGGGAVDPGAAFAGGVDGAAQQQRVGLGGRFVVEALFGEPDTGRVGQVEFGRDLAARLAFAHPQRVAAPAQHQLQRVDQDRLARARLARQGREAAAQRQIQRGNDDEITQVQMSQRHAVTRLPRSSGVWRAACRNSSSPGGAESARGSPSAAR